MRSSQDPIAGLKQKILDWGVLSEEELKEVDKQARTFVDKEVKEAEDSPYPESTPKELFADIYVSYAY